MSTQMRSPFEAFFNLSAASRLKQHLCLGEHMGIVYFKITFPALLVTQLWEKCSGKGLD